MWAVSQLRWHPGIGDPTFMGWFTVFAYGLAALLACRVALQQKLQSRLKEQKIWFFVAALMAILCLNKQLDLQSLFTDIGRMVAQEQGWYARRRGVQAVFVVLVILGSGWLLFWVTWKFRHFWQNHWLLLGGLFFTLTFIVVRATSFHHIDEMLRTRMAGIKLNWFLELTGISMVILATLLERRKLRHFSAGE